MNKDGADILPPSLVAKRSLSTETDSDSNIDSAENENENMSLKSRRKQKMGETQSGSAQKNQRKSSKRRRTKSPSENMPTIHKRITDEDIEEVVSDEEGLIKEQLSPRRQSQTQQLLEQLHNQKKIQLNIELRRNIQSGNTSVPTNNENQLSFSEKEEKHNFEDLNYIPDLQMQQNLSPIKQEENKSQDQFLNQQSLLSATPLKSSLQPTILQYQQSSQQKYQSIIYPPPQSKTKRKSKIEKGKEGNISNIPQGSQLQQQLTLPTILYPQNIQTNIQISQQQQQQGLKMKSGTVKVLQQSIITAASFIPPSSSSSNAPNSPQRETQASPYLSQASSSNQLSNSSNSSSNQINSGEKQQNQIQFNALLKDKRQKQNQIISSTNNMNNQNVTVGGINNSLIQQSLYPTNYYLPQTQLQQSNNISPLSSLNTKQILPNNEHQNDQIQTLPELKRSSTDIEAEYEYDKNQLQEELKSLYMEKEESARYVDELKIEMDMIINTNRQLQENLRQQIEDSSSAAVQRAIKLALAQQNERIKKIMEYNAKIGSVTFQRMNNNAIEVWVDGYEIWATTESQKKIIRDRLTVLDTQNESELIKVRSQSPPFAISPKQSISPSSFNSPSNPRIGLRNVNGINPSLIPSSTIEAAELRIELACINNSLIKMHSEEKRLEKRKHRLEQLKAQHIAESRRMRNELLGRFQVGIVLKNRYICTGFLGSGGFSSVYKAIDVGRRRNNQQNNNLHKNILEQIKEGDQNMQEDAEVALKIHRMNTSWNNERKQQYVKHVVREFSIQRQIQHPHIVGLCDVVVLSEDEIVTVLQFCEGGDLEQRITARINSVDTQLRKREENNHQKDQKRRSYRRRKNVNQRSSSESLSEGSGNITKEMHESKNKRIENWKEERNKLNGFYQKYDKLGELPLNGSYIDFDSDLENTDSNIYSENDSINNYNQQMKIKSEKHEKQIGNMEIDIIDKEINIDQIENRNINDDKIQFIQEITNNDEKIINSESSKKTIIDKENKVHQRQPYFSENEARLIIAQIFSALVHLSSLENPVIHYDIKPANILFHNGRAMLTDFGLSKVIESEARPEFNFNIIQQGSIKTDEGVGQLKIKQSTNLLTSAQSNPSDTSIITQSIPQPPLHIFGVGNTAVGQTLGGTPEIELTSQGAGTYWYLPPECFQHTDEFSRWPQSTVRISSKVDVWSVGVILYQMLCGTRPYAHRESPQEILLHHTQIFTREVTFPTNVSISDEAKDFIRKCLTHSPMQRMDSRLALMHPFLQPITKCGEISII